MGLGAESGNLLRTLVLSIGFDYSGTDLVRIGLVFLEIKS